MSYADLKAAGMSGGPGTNRIDPSRLFIVGLDGAGALEAERIEWLKGMFPKLASRIDALRDPRACCEVTEQQIAAFRPKHAASVKYENMGVAFPAEAGEWAGRPLIAVVSGRQRTKTLRAINARRIADGSPALEIQIEGRRYESDLDRREGKAIENASLVQQTPMHRAWLAHELVEGGMKVEDVAPLCNVTTEAAVRSLLGLLECSESVQRALDAGTVTQTVALELAKLGDHERQDAELTRRLEAAAGKTGRERGKAIRGEGDAPQPVRPKTLTRVADALSKVDRAGMADPHRVDEWSAIVRWALGDDAGYDALPDEFRAAVLTADKPKRALKEAA